MHYISTINNKLKQVTFINIVLYKIQKTASQ